VVVPSEGDVVYASIVPEMKSKNREGGVTVRSAAKPKSAASMELPSKLQPPDLPVVAAVDDDSEYQGVNTKYCHECGQKIRARAEIRPKCGVRQPVRADDLGRPNKSRESIKVPVLISAISNIVVGLIWAATCIGIVFTIPMVILCIFEFALWSKADSLSSGQLAGRAKTMGIFEIIVGLANTPTLICGIIVLINSVKLVDRYDR
jgi:hypothetical protein